MTTENQIKLNKLQKLAKLGSVPIYEELTALEDKNLTLEQTLLDAQNTFKEHIILIDGILHQLEDKKLDKEVFKTFGEGVKEALATIKLMPGPKGDKGDSYVLTNRDKQEIALDIKVPIVEKITERIETIKEQPIIQVKEVAMTDTPVQIVEKLSSLEGEDRLDKSAIKGLPELEAKVGTLGSAKVGWGAHPLAVQQSGSTKTKIARTINFTGATVTQSPSGVTTVSVTATGFQTPISGAVNGVNTTFVWTTAPNVIVVDGGRTMRAVSSDGTVNWTGGTTTILTVAPNFDIISVA